MRKKSWSVPAVSVPFLRACACVSVTYAGWILLSRSCYTKAMPTVPCINDSIWALQPGQLKLGRSHWRSHCLIKPSLITDTAARFSRGLQTWHVTWGRTLESSPTGTATPYPVCGVAKWVKQGNECSTASLARLQRSLLSSLLMTCCCVLVSSRGFCPCLDRGSCGSIRAVDMGESFGPS